MISKFKTKPYDHQLMAYNVSWDREYYALFMEMGTGKSKVIIDTYCKLHEAGNIGRVLIVAPKGVYLNWKANEIPAHTWDETPVNVAVYSASMKVPQKEILKQVMSSTEGLDILLMNIEALPTKKGYLLADKFMFDRPALMVIDESTAIKNPKGKRTKAALRLGKVAKYRRVLTGTPITHSPLDLYAQAEFLSPGLSGCPSFFVFKHTYAQQMRMNLGNRSFDKIIGFKNLEQLTETISNFSTRVLKSECLDLPDKIYQTREVAMTKHQKLLYLTLKHESLIMLEDGLLTSTNALTTMMKLHQILCGHVKDDFGNVTDIDNNRLQALHDVIDQINTESKVIIWCNFQRDVQLIKKALGDLAVTYYGLDDNDERETALQRFEHEPPETCRFFIGTPQTGGKGLTLNSGNYVIYYSNSFRLEDRLQSEDRCHRIGQEKNVTYIDLVIPDSIDSKVLKSLKDKNALAEQVLANVESFKDFI